MCLGFFVIQLDVTIVNVALPVIQREIGGSLAGLQWIIDAHTLALASIMLSAGSAADRFGARKVFVLGLSVFAAGSAACAVAPTLSILIAARAVQGLGASALLPCSLALLVHQFPDPRARCRALGVWGAMGSLGVALGPVLRFGPRPPMIAGLTLAASGAALLATARTGTAVILAGSVLLGLVSLAMPAMTAAVVGAAGPEHAGVASGILNAARQSGGALGAALLGSLLGSARGQGPGSG